MPRRRATRTDDADEAALLARVARGDEAAARAIIRRYNQRLYRVARGVLRDDDEAEDAVQEAYVRAFTHIATFRGESRLSTWLTRIVLNEALGRLRRRRPTIEMAAAEQAEQRRGQVLQFPNASAALDPERGLAQRQIQAMLERAIDELPEAFRTILIARVVEGMSIEETAELFDLEPATVKTRLHRARRLVKKTLEQRLGEALTSAFPFQGRRCERLADAVVKRLATLS